MTDAGKMGLKVISVVVMAITATLLIVSFVLAGRDANIYPSNIAVAGISLANLDNKEASHLLDKNLPVRNGNELNLSMGNKTIKIAFQDIGLTYEVSATLEKVNHIVLADEGRAAMLKHTLLRGKEQNITPVLSWDKTLLFNKMLDIKKDYDQPAVNARIKYNNDYLEYLSHKNGYSIDINSSINRISDALKAGSLGPVELAVTEVQPRVKVEDIETVKDVLGVSASALKCPAEEILSLIERINGLIIMPESSLALEHIVHKVTGINVSISVVKQLEETVAKACVQAGMEKNRNEFSFKNGLEHPLLLTVGIKEQTLLVKVYGCQTERGKEIKLITEQEELLPEVIIKVDRRLSPQQRIVKQEGQNGHILRTYRVVSSGDKLLEKGVLSEELTPATDTIIMVGPGSVRK